MAPGRCLRRAPRASGANPYKCDLRSGAGGPPHRPKLGPLTTDMGVKLGVKSSRIGCGARSSPPAAPVAPPRPSRRPFHAKSAPLSRAPRPRCATPRHAGRLQHGQGRGRLARRASPRPATAQPAPQPAPRPRELPVKRCAGSRPRSSPCAPRPARSPGKIWLRGETLLTNVNKLDARAGPT